MTVNAAQFRADFPEFTDASKYPDATINFWLGIAAARLDPCRWADLIDQGTELFVAHNVVLASQNQAAPGEAAGVVAAKTVDKISITLNTDAVMIEGAGEYNATSYGRQYWQLVRMVGMGGTQVI